MTVTLRFAPGTTSCASKDTRVLTGGACRAATYGAREPKHSAPTLGMSVSCKQVPQTLLAPPPPNGPTGPTHVHVSHSAPQHWAPGHVAMALAHGKSHLPLKGPTTRHGNPPFWGGLFPCFRKPLGVTQSGACRRWTCKSVRRIWASEC